MGGSWCLVKLRQIGTLGVQMKGILPWLVRWARRAGTIVFCPALSALVYHVQNIIFPHRTLFHFVSPQRPVTWAVGCSDFDFFSHFEV